MLEPYPRPYIKMEENTIGTNDEERYLELSKQIKKNIEDIKKLKVKLNGNTDSTYYKKIQEVHQELNKKERKIEDMIISIIGQMYNGVLIDNKLTIRRGKAYAYRCQYSISCNNLLEQLNTNAKEVQSKLGKKKSELVAFLMISFRELKNRKDDRDKIDIKEELKIEPITFFMDSNGYGNDIGGNCKIINKIIIHKDGMDVIEENGRETNLYGYTNVLESKYGEKIKEMTKKVFEDYIEYNKKLDKMIKDLEEKGGKFLIASTFQCQ